MYPFYTKKEITPKILQRIRKAEQPLVSVIIPSLPSRYLELYRAINTVKKQTYAPIEIIVEKGGRNVQEARNIAVARANGKYLAFLDDDDEFYPEKIIKQVEVMEANKDITLCITWGDDNKFGLQKLIKPKPWWSFDELVAGFNISCTSSFLCRKSSYDAVGGMDETLDDNHEYDLAIKLSLIGKVYCVQESLVRFNQSTENWSDDFGKKIRGQLQFIPKWGYAFNLKRWRNTVICLTLFTIGFLTPFLQPHPVHKIFNMTKDRREQLDEAAGEYNA